MNYERELVSAFDDLHNKSAERTWILARLGYVLDGSYVVNVANNPGTVYVSMGVDGDLGITKAQNRIGADTTLPWQRVKMRRENGQLLIREAEFLAAGGGSGATTLVALTDTAIASPLSGESLLFDGGTGKWINGTASSVTAHALSGIYHTGQLDDSQALQFLKHDGSRNLTGDLGVDAGITIDGVDLSAHAANPAAHHYPVTVGNGLTISGTQVLNFNLDTDPGLEFNASDANKLRVKIDSTLVRVSTGLGVDLTHNFTWTGTHTFNVTPQIHADLSFTGGDRSITSGAGDDVTIALGTGADLILASPMTFRSFDFSDGIPISGFGFVINTGGDRQLTINTLKSDSIHTRLLIYDGTRIDIGEEYWGKSVGTVHDNFITPASIGGTVTIYFEDNPRITGAIFTSGDWILMQYIDGGASGASFNNGYIWGQVSSYAHAGNDPDGRGYQSWTFTLRHGDLSQLVEKHNVAIDFGVSGQGYVHLSVLSDANGPWIRIGTWSGSDPFTAGNNQNRTQIGNLSGVHDTFLNPSGYGLYSDNAYLHGMIRTAQTIMDDSGFNLDIQDLDGTIATDTSDFSQIIWWDDVGARTGNKMGIVGYTDSSGFVEPAKTFNIMTLNVDNAAVDAAQINLRAGSGAAINLDSRGTIRLAAASINAQGSFLPAITLTYNLGSASFEWSTIYTSNLVVSGAVSGSTIGGQTWTYPGSMIIDAASAANTTVSVANSGAGTVDLDVARHITLGGLVDGVDLSALGASYAAHITNPDAHHNQVHVLATNLALGPDQTISGAAAGQVLRASSATAANFQALSHSDLTGITANQHHNQAHALATTTALGADHTVSGLTSGMVLKATGATTALWVALNHSELASVTANQHHNQVHGIVSTDHTGTGAALSVIGFTATDTLGVLVPSGDVTAGSGVSALLKSTSTGGLTLKSLSVKGAVDVTLGDFTVGINMLFVDVSQSNIGINRSPDPQFDLDVAGNLRAAYIVGKHAIQLDDALLIAHYDTKEPFETNRYGELNGHMGQVGTPEGGVTFVPGRFYAALSLGAAGTNTVLNPRFDVNVTDGWATSLGTGGAVTRSTEQAYIGQASAKIVNTSGVTYMQTSDLLAVANGSTVSISCWVFRSAGTGTVSLDLFNNTTSSVQAQAFCVGRGVWEELVITLTNSSGGARNYRLRISLSGADTVYVSACQRVAGFPVPYIDGDMEGYSASGKPDGTGYSWSGTAHNSTSVRVSSQLSYAASGNISNLRGTVMFWAKVPWGDNPTLKGAIYFFSVGASGTDILYLRKISSSSTLRVGIAGNDSAISVSGHTWDTLWHHYAVTWDTNINVSNLYIDGVLTATGVAGGFTPTAITVGSTTAGIANVDGYIDDFVITGDVETAGRILSIFASDAPVFASSSVFSFRTTPEGLVWADEEGLWMRNTTGDPVLGAYGGAAPTKSWSGLTLAPGDIVFGDGARGSYMLWDDSAATLTLGKTGTTTTNLLLNGTDLSFRVNATERIKLSGAGVLEVKDSGGAAVFTFNASAGAEFTKPLTLGSGGGIYQGSGSFLSPTTGIKIYNFSGAGKISGYNAGVEQIKIDTDGRLYAGGGKMRLDANGLFAKTSTSYDPVAAFSFGDSSFNRVSGLKAYYSPPDNTLTLIAEPVAGSDSSTEVTASSPTGHGALVTIGALVNGVSLASIQLNSVDSSVVVSSFLHVDQGSLTGTLAPLILSQSDTDAPMVNLIGHTPGIGTSQNFSTDALGTYRGKIQVVISGTTRWIPYYD